MVKGMSAVLSKTKHHYRRALLSETAIFALIGAVLIAWRYAVGMSFFLGVVCALVPFAVSVYWVFFRGKNTDDQRIKSFYSGEALKWLVTIILIISVLKLYVGLQIISFFAGYFLALIANSLVPFILLKRA